MSANKEVRKIRIGKLPSEKFARMAHTKQPHLKYNGGPLLGNVEVFTVFWGSAWQKQPALTTLSQGINDFFTFILTSHLLDQLAEYRVPAHAIRHRKLVGT